MDSYVDIRLNQISEFKSPVLMNTLYKKLHVVLVQNQSNNIGVSFPEYCKDGPFGNRLRLHGQEHDLKHLIASGWLVGFRDYVRIGEVSGVPNRFENITVRRVQTCLNPDRLRRRMMRRKNVSYEEAVAKIPDGIGERLKLPYLSLASESTGGRLFRLFIRQEKTEVTQVGLFNTFGLSREATLPFF
jgi:CRISPR-associated endonuclease Csy4